MEKQKTNTKYIRFQSPTFSKSLKKNQANAEISQKDKQGRGFRSIAKTITNGLFAILAITLFVSVIYWPRLFFIKKITVTGTNTAKGDLIVKNLWDELQSSNKLWPQQNIIVFDPQKFIPKIKSSFPDILEIKSVSKKFPNELVIDVADKVVLYEIVTPTGNFFVYNDGTLISINENMALTTKIVLLSDLKYKSGEKVFDDNFLNLLKQINESFEKITGEKIASIDILPDELKENNRFIQSAEITIKTEKNTKLGQQSSGFSIIIDVKKDANLSLSAIKILLDNQPVERYSQINYLDVRSENKAFVCLNNTACAK